MRQNKHKDDIDIGNGKWIEFIELTGRYDLAVDIDDLLAPIMDYIDLLETVCESMCCGFKAYDFTPEGIIASAKNNERDLLLRVKSVILSLENLDAQVIVSNRMNNLADKQFMLQLLWHIYNTIQNEVQSSSA